MKVLVLTISAGQGHNRTAYAIAEYLREINAEVEIIDTYKYFNTALGKFVEQGYLLSTGVLPGIYGTIYTRHEHKDYSNRPNMVDMTGKLISRQFYKFIEKKNPDAIIATHIFAANLVTHFKEKSKSKAVTYGIVTDFTVHPYWETTNLDYYITPSALLNNQMNKKGISEDKVLPFGIPISRKFAENIDKKEARKILGIADKRTVFVMTGSMGYGDVTGYIEELDSVNYDFQIITVCGSNKHLYNEIERLNTKKTIYNYGYVDNVEVIMSASDVIVSKPGGLTVSEALAKKLPMIIINPIPGHEDRNYEFLVNNGLAIGTSKTFSVEEAMYQLMNNPARLECMERMAEEIGKPDASKLLGDFVVSKE